MTYIIPSMIADVRKMLEAQPFVPFTIVTSGGNEYPVATADHADINPRGTQAVVWLDHGGCVIVPGLHMASLLKNSTPSV